MTMPQTLIVDKPWRWRCLACPVATFKLSELKKTQSLRLSEANGKWLWVMAPAYLKVDLPTSLGQATSWAGRAPGAMRSTQSQGVQCFQDQVPCIGYIPLQVP